MGNVQFHAPSVEGFPSERTRNPSPETDECGALLFEGGMRNEVCRRTKGDAFSVHEQIAIPATISGRHSLADCLGLLKDHQDAGIDGQPAVVSFTQWNNAKLCNASLHSGRHDGFPEPYPPSDVEAEMNRNTLCASSLLRGSAPAFSRADRMSPSNIL